jgi:hypothetical protein
MVVTPPDQAESRAARRKRMVAEMSNANTLKWVGVALVLHVILIGATSISYMRTHWFGKNDAQVMDDAKSATPAQAEAASDKPAVVAPQAPAAEKTAITPPAPSPQGLSDDDKKLAELKNNPEVKKVTATAKPGELPKSPSLKGIDDNP